MPELINWDKPKDFASKVLPPTALGQILSVASIFFYFGMKVVVIFSSFIMGKNVPRDLMGSFGHSNLKVWSCFCSSEYRSTQADML